MKKKIMAILFSTALVASLLIACGGNGGGAEADTGNGADAGAEETTETAETAETDDNDEAPPAEVDPGEVVTLRVLGSAGGHARHFEAIIPQFEAEGINIIFDAFDFVTYEGRQRLAIAAGGGEYDLIFLPGNAVHTASRAGAVKNLDALMAELFPDESDIYDSTQRFFKFEGSWYAVPHSSETMILYYRTDLIDESELPTTMEELYDLAASLMSDELYGLAIPGGPGEAGSSFYSYFLWSFGGEYFDENWEPQLNTPEAIAAAEMFARLNQDLAPVGVTTWQNEETVAAFSSGTLAMMIMWPGFFRSIDDPENSLVAGNVGVAPVPAGPAGARPRFGSWGLAATANTNYPEAAMRVLEIWGSQENLEAFSLAAASSSSKTVNALPSIREANPVVDAATALLNYADERPPIPEAAEINTAVGNAINSIIAGMDAETVLEALNIEVRNILAAAGYFD